MKSVNIALHKRLFPDINEDGWKFISVMAVLTIIFALLWIPFGIILFILDILCWFSFRDTPRVTPVLSGAVIAPADGIIISINKEKGPDCLGLQNKTFHKIRIYSNLLNAHIIRMPIKAKIGNTFFESGKKFSASFNPDNITNERFAVVLRHPEGIECAMVQTTVFCNKRIVCSLKKGQEYPAGIRIGSQRFGGYTDVFLPEKTCPQVCVGQTMIAGETMMADIKSDAPRLEGEIL